MPAKVLICINVMALAKLIFLQYYYFYNYYSNYNHDNHMLMSSSARSFFCRLQKVCVKPGLNLTVKPAQNNAPIIATK